MFQTEFCDPIRQGGYAGSSFLKIEIATKTASMLQRIVKPYLLRRRKDQIGLFGSSSNDNNNNNANNDIDNNTAHTTEAIAKSTTNRFFLPEKTEHVIFCQLTKRQKYLYLKVLDSPEVQSIIQNRLMPFRAISALRKLCNHPAMLTNDDYDQLLLHKYKRKFNAKYQLSENHSHNYKRQYNNFDSNQHLIKFVPEHIQFISSSSSSSAVSAMKDKYVGNRTSSTTTDSTNKSKSSINQRTRNNNTSGTYDTMNGDCYDDDNAHIDSAEVDVTWSDSGKLLVLLKILPVWLAQGHKVLLFSQTQSMLNILETLFKQSTTSSSSSINKPSSNFALPAFKYLRLDGSTAVYRRESIIHRFNTDPGVFLILLTTKTGGVGISLTAANKYGFDINYLYLFCVEAFLIVLFN